MATTLRGTKGRALTHSELDANFTTLEAADAALAAADAAAATTLAASSGSALVGFVQKGTGAVSRTAQDKNREFVSVKDFGAIGDGVADDYAAIMAAINSSAYGAGYYISGPSVYFPPGDYRCSQAIQLKRSVKLWGDGSGLPSTSTARLIFDAGVSGIIVHRYDTIDNTVEVTPTTAGDASTIEGLIIRGAYGAADAMGGHGIWLRARAVIRNVAVGNFTGNGFHVVADTAGTTDIIGNANNFVIETGRATGNGGWGVYVQGGDANAGSVSAIDCTANGSGGFCDKSFLGNTYTACHTSDNGGLASGYNTTLGRTSMVTYGGNRYFATYGATLAQLVATVPGTSSAVWTLESVGGVSLWHPLWVAGKQEGSYFVSNQYRSTDPNARNLFLGCYQEGGYSNSHLAMPSLAVGGLLNLSVGGQILNTGGEVVISPMVHTPKLRYSNLDLVGEDSYAFVHQYVTGRWGYVWGGLDTPTYLSFYDRTATVANGYARTIGNSTAPSGNKGAIGLSQYYFGNSAQMKYRGLGAAAPTAGEYLQGDIIWNLTPTAGGHIGWVCTVSGDAALGTAVFKTWGAISA